MNLMIPRSGNIKLNREYTRIWTLNQPVQVQNYTGQDDMTGQSESEIIRANI